MQHEGALPVELKAKFADPAVRQALSYWVMFCINQMGSVKSEKVIKLSLLKRLNGRVSRQGIEFIYTLAQQEYQKQQHGTAQQN